MLTLLLRLICFQELSKTGDWLKVTGIFLVMISYFFQAKHKGTASSKRKKKAKLQRFIVVWNDSNVDHQKRVAHIPIHLLFI